MGEEYVSINVILIKVNPRSFIVMDEEDNEHIIGRSCVHGVDEPTVAEQLPGSEVKFRIFRWLASKENLI